MKKVVLCSALVLLLSVVMAQNEGKTARSANTNVQFGVKGGLSLANLESDFFPTSEYKTAFHVGVFAHIHLSSNFALQPEVTYSAQGSKIDAPSVKWDINYINVPVLFQYMNKGFRVETGPQVGFLLNAKRDENDGGEDKTLKEQLKKTDISWDFGVGYLAPIGIGVGARYNLGLTDINDKITNPVVGNAEIKNRVFQFSVFYQFR